MQHMRDDQRLIVEFAVLSYEQSGAEFNFIETISMPMNGRPRENITSVPVASPGARAFVALFQICWTRPMLLLLSPLYSS
jgi:hypothetical protein